MSLKISPNIFLSIQLYWILDPIQHWQGIFGNNPFSESLAAVQDGPCSDTKFEPDY